MSVLGKSAFCGKCLFEKRRKRITVVCALCVCVGWSGEGYGGTQGGVGGDILAQGLKVPLCLLPNLFR